MRGLLFICLLAVQLFAMAGVEYREFDDAATQQQYHDLIHELRCLVCQNQTIADSNADLAKDLREQVYEMLEHGKSRQDVIDFMVQRYGDFVLYRPQFYSKTLLLWLGPVVFVIVGLLAIVTLARRKSNNPQTELSTEQKAKVQALLDEGKDQ